MPRCIQCDETYADNLRRCPHCGEKAEAPPPGDLSALGTRKAPVTAAGRHARKMRSRRLMTVVGIALAAGSIAVVMAWPREAPPDREAPARAATVAEIAAEAVASLAPPDEVSEGDPAHGFTITEARFVDGEVAVSGTIAFDAVVSVTVDGQPATISPDGTRFSVRLPLASGSVDVVATGIGGGEARLAREVVASPAPPPAGDLRVRSHAEGSTVSVAHIRLEVGTMGGGSGGPMGSSDVALDALENRVTVGGRPFTLYRAPPGLTFLRITPKGQHAFLRRIDGQEVILVPGGLSRRGEGRAPPHGPAHIVRMPPLLIDRSEVTGGQFAEFLDHMRRTGDRALCHTEDPGLSYRPKEWPHDECPAGLEALPVTGVSWFAAYAYARWVGGHLPSEAEWERAGAGPLGLAYAWGDEFDLSRCWHGEAGPLPADSLPGGEGPYSLLHMSGNVREWCEDRFDPRWYERCSRSNPRGPSQNLHRVVRGGSFASPADCLRLQHRDHLEPVSREADLGFRVVMRWVLRERGP